MASQITSLTIVYSTVYSRWRSKKTSKLRVTGLCEGNSPVTSEFPAQRASNAENVSICWSHHGNTPLLAPEGVGPFFNRDEKQTFLTLGHGLVITSTHIIWKLEITDIFCLWGLTHEKEGGFEMHIWLSKLFKFQHCIKVMYFNVCMKYFV